MSGMYFLIDYENVKENGLSGFEHLTSNDDVLIFFSESTSNIKQGVWKKLCDTGCSIEICKLAKVRKNGLDFYIASRVGEIVAQDPSERIAIISGDSGFMAVVDYWQKCRGNKYSVVVGNTISMGIMYSKENSQRARCIEEFRKKVDIETAFQTYQKQTMLKAEIKTLLEGSNYEDKVDDIFRFVEESSSYREKYLGALKRYGRKDGLNIYRFVKKVV